MMEFVKLSDNVHKILNEEMLAISKIILQNFIRISEDLPDVPETREIFFNSLFSGIVGKILACQLIYKESEDLEDFYDAFSEATKEYFLILIEMEKESLRKNQRKE